MSIWPRFMTSRARLFLGNQLWSAVPAIRADLLDLANRRHVILAEQTIHGILNFQDYRPTMLDVLTISRASPEARFQISHRRDKSVLSP